MVVPTAADSGCTVTTRCCPAAGAVGVPVAMLGVGVGFTASVPLGTGVLVTAANPGRCDRSIHPTPTRKAATAPAIIHFSGDFLGPSLSSESDFKPSSLRLGTEFSEVP